MGPNGIRGTRGVPCARGKRRADHHRRCFDALGIRAARLKRLCDPYSPIKIKKTGLSTGPLAVASAMIG
jgi:hypothetical protein